MTDHCFSAQMVPFDGGLGRLETPSSSSRAHNVERPRIIVQGSTVWLDERDATCAAMALLEWVARARTGPRRALLVGGPRHGEFLVPPDNAGSFEYQELVGPTTACLVDLDACKPEATVTIKTARYHRMRDVAFDGQPLPFDIYEHDDIRDSNVKRAAERLDDEAVNLDEEIKRQRKAIAESERQLREVYDRRNEIMRDHGV